LFIISRAGISAILPSRRTLALGAAIRTAMAELSPRQRECLRLQHFEDMKISEIAAVTGIETGSVKQHLFRAATTLRRKLAKFAEVRS